MSFQGARPESPSLTWPAKSNGPSDIATMSSMAEHAQGLPFTARPAPSSATEPPPGCLPTNASMSSIEEGTPAGDDSTQLSAVLPGGAAQASCTEAPLGHRAPALHSVSSSEQEGPSGGLGGGGPDASALIASHASISAGESSSPNSDHDCIRPVMLLIVAGSAAIMFPWALR